MGSKVCMKGLGLDRGRATFSTVMGEQEDFRCPESAAKEELGTLKV